MSKSRDIADSAATINYIDGLTSDAQTQIDSKATLDASPTFTGTVTATAFSGDGSGLTGVDSLPSQSGNSGKYLTTDGTDASWGEVSAGLTVSSLVTLPSGGTSVEFTSLPSGINYIILHMWRVSGNDTQNDFSIQLGGSSGYKTSGYIGKTNNVNNVGRDWSDALNLIYFDSTGILDAGMAIISRVNGNKWMSMAQADGTYFGNCIVDLGEELTKLKFCVLEPGRQFDNGEVSISYM